MRYKVRLWQDAYAERWFTVDANSKEEAAKKIIDYETTDLEPDPSIIVKGDEVTYTDSPKCNPVEDVFEVQQGGL